MSVLQITAVCLETFLAQLCKHPNLPKHCSNHHKIGSTSRTIPIIAEWMLNLHHIYLNFYDFKNFSSNSELSHSSFLATPQVGSSALQWQNKTLQLWKFWRQVQTPSRGNYVYNPTNQSNIVAITARLVWKAKFLFIIAEWRFKSFTFSWKFLRFSMYQVTHCFYISR